MSRFTERRFKLSPVFVFISHSAPDTWIARHIAAKCQEVSAETFLDEAAIAIGADFETDILTALKRSDEFVVLLTPWALERPYVWLEIGAAWYKQIPIVAIVLGVTPQQIQEHSRAPIAIKERNIIELNAIDRYFRELGERVREERTAGEAS
jgi:succinylglutamate desuccinylase